MNENIINLYSDIRNLMLSTESSGELIKKIDNQQLREKILELFCTCQADLLILTDFLFEISQCESEDDLNLLLDLNTDFEGC